MKVTEDKERWKKDWVCLVIKQYFALNESKVTVV